MTNGIVNPSPDEILSDQPRFAGFLESVNADRLGGWAWDSQRPDDPIDVDIYVDGSLTRTIRADHLGADLLNVGIGNGYHRWSCPLSELISDDNLHEFAVRFSGTDTQLGHSPKKYLRGVLDLLSDLEPQAMAAALYLRGTGLEIGALDSPLRVPAMAETRYVDRMSTEDLRIEYPEMKDADLVPVSIVADGETLAGVEDNSQDYVIANNFLEHCEDPIATLKNFFRVVRPSGVLFLVVPNKRSNLDRMRPETTIEHLIKDHEKGPEKSRTEHYREWARTILKVPEDRVRATAAKLAQEKYSIHFHVFTEFETIELFCLLRNRYKIPFIFEHVANHGCHETVVVARKE
jgi:SAM-dependent methyltransferase